MISRDISQSYCQLQTGTCQEHCQWLNTKGICHLPWQRLNPVPLQLLTFNTHWGSSQRSQALCASGIWWNRSLDRYFQELVSWSQSLNPQSRSWKPGDEPKNESEEMQLKVKPWGRKQEMPNQQTAKGWDQGWVKSAVLDTKRGFFFEPPRGLICLYQNKMN